MPARSLARATPVVYDIYMTYTKIIFAILISMYAAGGAMAQTLETTVSTTTTADELCTMANGNRIPCEFLQAAEKDVVTGGKVVDQVSGKEYYKTGDRYVPCEAIKADGSVTLKSRLEQYTNIVIFVLAKYWLYILITLGIALISIVASRKLSKK